MIGLHRICVEGIVKWLWTFDAVWNWFVCSFSMSADL